MISCPLCGAKTRVTETRMSDTSARRRRVCSSAGCLGKVTTIEIVVPEGRASFLGKGSIIIPASKLKKLREALAGLEGIEL